MNLTNIENGLILLVIGMGFVMIFLSIMICLMRVTSKIVIYLNKIFPEAVEEVKTAAKKVNAGADEAIAVALAAIAAKRKG